MAFGGIECGGTKFRCGVSVDPPHVAVELTVPTTTPAETLREVTAFFTSLPGFYRPAAVGIACFGPLDLRPDSPTFGHITSTPKPGWQNVDVVSAVSEALGVERVSLDTDVNAAAMAEYRWGAGQRVSNLAYVTVGTGIGCGIVLAGRPIRGLIHPEFGHVRVPHDITIDPFAGSCPVHRDCLEGLASGRAIAERWRAAAEDLPKDHPAWPLETQYLAVGLTNLICTISPERIIVGGGVSQSLDFRQLRAAVRTQLGGYLRADALAEAIDHFIVPPALGKDAGLIGALALAQASVDSAEADRHSPRTAGAPR